MNHQLTEEQQYELFRFNTAAAQYAPNLYCTLSTSFCIYPPALGGSEFTTASVGVFVWQHPTADSPKNAAVASIPFADDFDAALLEMRAQLTACFGFMPDPADLEPINTEWSQRLKRQCNDPRITRPEKTLVLLNINRMTQGQARAKAAELQGYIDTRPLPSRRDWKSAGNAAAVA